MSEEEKGSAGKPCVPDEYALKYPQVEPDASYWMYCSKLHIVSIHELKKLTDDTKSPYYFPPYPDPCTAQGAAEIQREFDELVALSKLRDDPDALTGAASGSLGARLPLSKLLNLTPPALGAVVAHRFPGEQIIRTGRGMARAVEGETPGLFHRHALNYLIPPTRWSPPRQALIWAALDVALASALQAAWYYKWLSRRPLTSRRERPIEYAKRKGLPLNILFDLPDELNPAYNSCPPGRDPNSMSGTPRHPAYPSGHSTYSGAASALLEHFFGNVKAFEGAQPSHGVPASAGTMKTELDNLADNIGMGRLWAGIHWRSDHINGMKLGRAVAHLVLQQLADMGINLCASVPACDPNVMPPSVADLEKKAASFEKHCPEPKKIGPPCPGPAESLEERIDKARGVQQTAQ